MLKGDDLVDALAELIERHPDGKETLPLGFIDGALAGLLLLPEVPEEEWLPRLRAGPDAGFADPEDGKRFARLLVERRAEMAGELLSDAGRFAPLYPVDDQGEVVWQLWLFGFASVLGARQGRIEEMARSDDEDLATAWSGLIAMIAQLPGFEGALEAADDLPPFDDLLELAPDLLAYFVETIYRRQHGLPRLVKGDGPAFDADLGFGGGFDDYLLAHEPVRVTKIGRNEPCPCGSGKKYKKCCGG